LAFRSGSLFNWVLRDREFGFGVFVPFSFNEHARQRF
jgi:hypothetical protein